MADMTIGERVVLLDNLEAALERACYGWGHSTPGGIKMRAWERAIESITQAIERVATGFDTPGEKRKEPSDV